MQTLNVLRRLRSLRRAVALARLQRYRLRKLLRDDVFVLVIAAACVGAASGVIAASMAAGSEALHGVFFGLAPGQQLSSMNQLSTVTTLVVLTAGGLVVGATYLWQSNRPLIVDPIEANALHGGRMSLRDSVFVAIQSFLSSSFGLSLGIEGGFTQVAGAIGSKVGQLLKRRRLDVRMLVGAGTAGGIAGAFGAPFAGAPYGFELIVGSYTVANLAPVVTAAVAGAIAANAIIGHTYHISLNSFRISEDSHAVAAVLLGIVSGLLSVVLMRGVTTTERIFYNSGLRTALRPVAGGTLVAVIAIFVPHVLGSGHQAMARLLQGEWPLSLLAAVLAAKIAASALSLGSGFRGGLFSTSLFLGVLTGATAGKIGLGFGLLGPPDIAMLSLVGMASFGAAVVGAPMTMALLAVEITGELSVVGPVLLGVLAAVLTVRQVFGYSFATWRFHLRGEAILGGEDVGWVRQTTARDLMRHDLTVVPVTTRLSDFRAQFPLGSRKFVAAVDSAGAFVGLIDVASLHAEPAIQVTDLKEKTLEHSLVHRASWVEAGTRFDRLVPLFERQETELLVVVDDPNRRRPIGLISEAFALRRYRQELEARQREIFGS
jgi:CIC family chloride channel protein